MHQILASSFSLLRALSAILLIGGVTAGCGGNELGDTPVSRCVPEGACPEHILESGIRASLGDPSVGAATYTANCTRCHGEDGVGSGDASRIDMTSPAWQASMRDAGIIATVRAGRGALMPAFSFTDQELRDLLAHLRNLVREGAAPPPGVAPTKTEEPNRGGY